MIEAKVIKAEDLKAIGEVDEHGDYKIPSGIRIFKEESETTVKKRRVIEIENQLRFLSEPTSAELIEIGCEFSIFHQLTRELNELI